MKTRNGFVSNSSSSSFILMTTKEVADKAKETLSPYEKIAVEFLEQSPTKFCDIDVVGYQVTSGNDDSFEYFSLKEYDYKPGSDENEEWGPHDAWEKFCNKVQEIGVGKIITRSDSY